MPLAMLRYGRARQYNACMNNNTQSDVPTVAILGGGQLGAYLCQAAGPLGFRTRVLATSAPSSVDDDADYIHVGALDSVDDVMHVANGADVVTYEIESIGPACLDALEASGIEVHPAPDVLKTLQNKVSQRAFYAAHNFPSPRWTSRETVTTECFDALADELGMPFVQKAATGGYDGKGVQVVRQPSDLRLDFGQSLFEELVPLKNELGMLVARSTTGETCAYPPVEMRFWGDNILDVAVCPAEIPKNLHERAMQLAMDVVSALDGVGLFCLELFVDTDEQLLTNEIAARVHNSGHLTIEGSETSQFEQHLRAISGMPLGPTTVPRPAVMKNLLSKLLPGTPGPFGAQPAHSDASATVHWYMKPDAKPLRKMGHITAVADQVGDAIAAAESRTTQLGFTTSGE